MGHFTLPCKEVEVLIGFYELGLISRQELLFQLASELGIDIPDCSATSVDEGYSNRFELLEIYL